MARLRLSIVQILFVYVLNSHSSLIKTDAPLFKRVPSNARDVTHVRINLTSSQFSCDVRFLSVAIGTRRITLDWNGSEKLLNLASALSPADLRLGGTSANYLSFDPSVKPGTRDRFYTAPVTWPYTVTGRQWDLFVSFLQKVGWDLLFGLNNFMWNKDRSWDTSNADLFLNYSSAKGVKIPYFQLGNEPNAYPQSFSISAHKLAQDYRTLKNLISKYPLYVDSKLCGPDVSNVARRWRAREYLQRFVDAGANDVIDEISIHHYYKEAYKARAEDFISPTIMNYLKDDFVYALNISKASSRPLPISLTETASCSGGGAYGLSDRYIAGFLWLDKLGLAAQYGVTRVFRQAFFGGIYALVTYKHDPTPDFYLSVLYKRLIEGPVLTLNINPPNPKLRLYAHCARDLLYSPGALVVYYLNLQTTKAVLSLSQFAGYDLDLYQLTPGDENGLTSRYVKLNGHILRMSGSRLPPMPPRHYIRDVTVEALSFGFIVVPDADVSLCVEHFREVPINTDVEQK